MKKFIFAIVTMAILPQLYSQNVNCKIKGSDTVLPLTQKEAEVFMKKYTGSSIMVTGGGSGVGIAALQNGTTDIAWKLPTGLEKPAAETPARNTT